VFSVRWRIGNLNIIGMNIKLQSGNVTDQHTGPRETEHSVVILDWGPVPHFAPWRHCNQCGQSVVLTNICGSLNILTAQFYHLILLQKLTV
jgi:hypothetical protein